MKLLNKVLLHLSVVASLVLMAWAVWFYYAIMDEVNDEVDDSLEDYSEWIITRSLAGESLPSNDAGSNNQYYLTEITREMAMSQPSVCYKDSMVYLSAKKETEPARILTTIFKDNDEQFYQLDVFVPTIEKSDLQESIFILIAGLYVALLLAFLVINWLVFNKTMKPFYKLLHWIDRNRLGIKNDKLDNPTDTTEFKQLNEAVERYANHSEAVFEQQKQFIGNASHEMQTPLAVCRNRIEMMMEEDTLPERIMDELAKMHRTLEHATRLNKSLLLLSKIDNHQFSDVKEISLNEVLDNYMEDYKEVYGYKGIRLSIAEEGTFKVEMNETLAGVLVTNLLKNAYINNVDGGKLEVLFKPDCMIISNTGELVPLDGEKIFERFHQGKKREGSTGLGLAIVRSICMEYHLQVCYQFADSMHTFIVYR